MAIEFDSASNSAYQAALSTYSWSHVCVGSQRLLVVGVSVFAAGTVSSITYNGINLTFIRADENGIYRTELWYLIAPDTGSNTIVVTLSASLTSIAGAVSYTGVDPYTAIEANNGANGVGTEATVVVTTVLDGDWVVDCASTSDTAITVGDGQSSRVNATGALGTGAMSDEGPKSPVGSVTMNWTAIGALDSWAISSVALRAAPVGVQWRLNDVWPVSLAMEFTAPTAESVAVITPGSRPRRMLVGVGR